MVLVISKTPVRISFFGGGSDYTEYYLRKKGAILGTTIDQYTYVTVKKTSPFFPHKMRLSYSKVEAVNSLEEIEHPSIRECLRFYKLEEPLDVHICSDLPARTGLGSSSSFTVGFLHALAALQGRNISKNLLAKEACFVEQQMIREKVGSQDQYHASFGGCNLMEFSPKGIEVFPLPIPEEKRLCFMEHLMLFYTGTTRFAEKVIQEQIQNTKENKNDSFLETMVSLVYEAKKIFLEQKELFFPEKLAELLDYSWQLKQKLSSQISNETINLYYEKARKAGALGGKLCGAGQSGFLLLMVPPSKKMEVKEALRPLFAVPFSLEKEGSSLIYRKDL